MQGKRSHFPNPQRRNQQYRHPPIFPLPAEHSPEGSAPDRGRHRCLRWRYLPHAYKNVQKRAGSGSGRKRHRRTAHCNRKRRYRKKNLLLQKRSDPCGVRPQPEAGKAGRQAVCRKKARVNVRGLCSLLFLCFYPNWNLFYLKSSFSLCPFYMISVSITGNLYESYVIFLCSALPKSRKHSKFAHFFTKNGCFLMF